MMIDGCLEWQRDGLKVPNSVRKATDEYLADQDTLGQWADERIEPSPDAFAKTRDLFTSWKRFCDDRNLAAGTETAFADSLKDRGYEQKRAPSGRGFKGIALKSNDGGEPWDLR
jgi:putative DNA primase/helicase